MKKTNKFWEIYTDGGCIPNPGTGAFGFVILKNGKLFTSFAKVHPEETTNNRCELMAVIKAVNVAKKLLDDEIIHLHIYTDSQYVYNGITKWIKGWIKKDFDKVLNDDLWKIWASLEKTYPGKIELHWVRGHAGNKWNEYVDKLCSAKIENARNELKKHN